MANDNKKNETPKAEVTEASFDEKVAAAVAKALSTALPAMGKEIASSFGTAMVAAEMAKTATQHDQQLVILKKKLAKEEKCQLCGQSVGDGKNTGCGGPWKRDAKTGAFITEPVLHPDGTPAQDSDGKTIVRRIEDYNQFHEQRVVFPKDPIAAEWFDGVTINGARYYSQGPSHRIWVPKNTDIDAIVSVYTQNEVEQRVGRKHIRRNGGTLSGKGGSSTAPLGVGFN